MTVLDLSFSRAINVRPDLMSHAGMVSSKLPRFRRTAASGFALVAVLFMVALLMVVLVAFALHLQVELNSSGNTELRSQARQNALLALNLAVGALQKEMGPDQRVSATAAIYDTNPSTDAIDGVAQPYWTGVWTAYNWDGTGTPSPNATTSFRRWLVSTSDSATAANLQAPLTPSLTATNSVLMVSSGTLGSSSTTGTVRVWKIPADTDKAGRQGNYAWWVGDEGVKAKVNVMDPRQSLTSSDEMALLAAAPRSAAEAVTTYSNLQTALPTATMAKLISRGEMPLVLTAIDGSTYDFRPSFHDFTVYSQGILSDTQRGGLRKDLSLLLELGTLPSDFNQHPIFTDQRTTTDTTSSPTSATNVANGPDWNVVYRYYNLYSKMVKDADGVFAFNMDAYNSSLRTSGVRDYILPVPSSCQYLFGLLKMKHNYMYTTDPAPPAPKYDHTIEVYLVCYPVLTLWNPYNVRLRSSQNSPYLGQYWQLPGTPLAMIFDGGATVPMSGILWMGDDVAGCFNTVSTGDAWSISVPKNISLEPGAFQVWGADPTSDNLSNHYMPGTGYGRRDINMRPGFDYTIPYHSDWLKGVQLPVDSTDLVTNVTNVKVLFTTSLSVALSHEFGSGVSGSDSSQPTYNTLTGIVEWNINGGGNFIDSAIYPQQSITVSSIPTNTNTTAVSKSTDPYSMFVFNYNMKIYPDDIKQASRFAVFADPTSPFQIQSNGNAATAQMGGLQVSVDLTQGGNDDYLPNGQHAFRISNNNPGKTVYPNNEGYLGTLTSPIYNYTWTELPIAPLVSLAQLQHAQLGRDYGNPIWNTSMNSWYGTSGQGNLGSMASMPVAAFNRALGNSYANPLIASNSVKNSRSYDYDRCVTANYAMWDSYFFSSITPQQSTVFGSNTRPISQVLDDFLNDKTPLRNVRYEPWLGAAGTVTGVESTLLNGNTIVSDAYKKSAAYLMVDGSFNVNSVSVDAWTAVLGGTHNFTVPYMLPTGNSSTGIQQAVSTLFPFGKFTLPNGAALDPSTATTFWDGFRELNSADIRLLAEKIVAQIKKRGPALSLAGFVNRQVSNDSQLSLSGAVQAALDDANLNAADGTKLPSTSSFTKQVSASDVSSASYPNSNAATGAVATGTTPWLTQADILTPIAPILTVHSDTFVVRAYGDVTLNGITLSRAWCEAVVQRVPEYVDGSNSWADPTASNQQFGRQFKIIQFRWLNQQEL